MIPVPTAPVRAAAESDTAQIAKAALRRLVTERLEPTPENYSRAYRLEAGQRGAEAAAAGARRAVERLAQSLFDERGAAAFALEIERGRGDVAERALVDARAADGEALAALIEHVVRGVDRSARGWSAGRKRESLKRVLEGSRGDARRLRQRLGQLVAAWEADATQAPAEPDFAADVAAPPAAPSDDAVAEAARTPALDLAPWRQLVASLAGTLANSIEPPPQPGPELAQALAACSARIAAGGADPALAAEVDALCDSVRRLAAHRDHLLGELGELVRELTASLAELSESDSWSRGQCEAMQVALADGLNARGVRAVAELLRETRGRQGALRAEREQARSALKTMIQRMLGELGTLGDATGKFSESMGRYADTVEQADSLEGLAGVVREMVQESRSVQTLVQGTHAELQAEHARATALDDRVRQLESQLQQLSDEVATDQLTKVANRRGLIKAFEAEAARAQRDGTPLGMGLIDIDNFKRLNDTLGHAAGDEALKTLAAAVRERLRPTDHVARFGGEEFVVLLPATDGDESQQILSRLQRSLSGSLFMHDQKPVFVTFSAGVTTWCDGETLEAGLERADQALYEAKRTGKNRTCIA